MCLTAKAAQHQTVLIIITMCVSLLDTDPEETNSSKPTLYCKWTWNDVPCNTGPCYFSASWATLGALLLSESSKGRSRKHFCWWHSLLLCQRFFLQIRTGPWVCWCLKNDSDMPACKLQRHCGQFGVLYLVKRWPNVTQFKPWFQPKSWVTET